MVVKDNRELRSILAGNPNLISKSERAVKGRDGFQHAWAPLAGRCETLRYFAAGIATVFEGSSTAESDFSVIKYEENSFSSNRANFSLEETLHANQRSEVPGMRA